MRMGMTDFGEGRKPCWIILDCSKYVYPDCLAYQCPEKPAGNMIIRKTKPCSVLKESASTVGFLNFIIMIKADYLIIWV
jgi:hypothetical protein